MSKNSYNRSKTAPAGYSMQPDGRAVLYTGTYVGFVRDNNDELKMGRLKVWIPDLGSDPDDEQTWFTVNYCSPFAGATPITQNKKDSQNWMESQRSYGFWAVPPDLDNEVIVQFINGDPNKGIWIGCLYKQYMNHMVPGMPINESFQEGEGGVPPPTVEYNKWSEVGNNLDPKRPRFDPLHYGLKMQGLYSDPKRGPSSAGARRESPSKVFGMMTPRGNHFYIDDNEENEHIRLRTRSGVQIVLNDTDGFIYMISKKGNSYFELSDDGIDMYSTKGVNIHSTNGYNFHTDTDYSMHIGGNFKVFVEGDYQVSTVGNFDSLVGKDKKEDIGGAYHSTIQKDRNISIEGSDNLSVLGMSTTQTNTIFTVQAGNLILLQGANVLINPPSAVPEPGQPAEAKGPTPADAPEVQLSEGYPSTTRKTISARMPTHEPSTVHPKAGPS